jgi:hypothetical protein
MNSLIFTLLAIALSAAVVLTTVSYLPAWQPAAAQAQAIAQAGFDTLETAHYLASKATGLEPLPTAETDGGVVTNLSAYYSFLPPAPEGYAWKYGNDGVSGYNWLCLHGASAAGTKAVWEALSRLKTTYSTEQYFVHSGGAANCGTASNAVAPTTYPAQFSATLFVRYVLGT